MTVVQQSLYKRQSRMLSTTCRFSLREEELILYKSFHLEGDEIGEVRLGYRSRKLFTEVT